VSEPKRIARRVAYKSFWKESELKRGEVDCSGAIPGHGVTGPSQLTRRRLSASNDQRSILALSGNRDNRLG